MNHSVLLYTHYREGSKRGFPLLEGSGSSLYNVHSHQPCPRSTGERFAGKSLAGGAVFPPTVLVVLEALSRFQ